MFLLSFQFFYLFFIFVFFLLLSPDVFCISFSVLELVFLFFYQRRNVNAQHRQVGAGAASDRAASRDAAGALNDDSPSLPYKMFPLWNVQHCVSAITRQKPNKSFRMGRLSLQSTAPEMLEKSRILSKKFKGDACTLHDLQVFF